MFTIRNEYIIHIEFCWKGPCADIYLTEYAMLFHQCLGREHVPKTVQCKFKLITDLMNTSVKIGHLEVISNNLS